MLCARVCVWGVGGGATKSNDEKNTQMDLNRQIHVSKSRPILTELQMLLVYHVNRNF